MYENVHVESIEETLPKQNLKLVVKLVNEGRNLAVEIQTSLPVAAAWSSTRLWRVMKRV